MPNPKGFLFFLLAAVLLNSCKEQAPKESTSVQEQFFSIGDGTQLTLPPSFILSEKENANSKFIDQQRHAFLGYFKQSPISIAYFADSLQPTHQLVAYQVNHKDFNQNLASLLNTRVYIHFQQLDIHQTCYTISNVASMQYASKKWSALKFKYLLSPEHGSDCDKNASELYTSVYYYNGQNKAYYFVENNSSISDLDAFLRKVEL